MPVIDEHGDPRLDPLRKVLAIAVQGFINRRPQRRFTLRELHSHTRRISLDTDRYIHRYGDDIYLRPRRDNPFFHLSITLSDPQKSVDVSFGPTFDASINDRLAWPYRWSLGRRGAQLPSSLGEVMSLAARAFTWPYPVETAGALAREFAWETVFNAIQDWFRAG